MLPGIGVLLLLVIGGVVVMQQMQKAPSPLSEDSKQTSSETVENFVTSVPDTADLKAGGSSYREVNGLYTFLYPNDYELFTQPGDPHTRITKKGATQKGQTELYDGVLIDFESVNLDGMTLEAFVDKRITEATANGMSEVVDAKKMTKLNNYPGFTYELRGLGTTRYLAIQKDVQSDSAVILSFLVADPENMGYQKEVDAILSTLELLQ